MASRKPSPAMVVAVAALVIALGGGAWAAISLQKGQVKTKHIAKGAVKTKQLGRGAVKTKQLADRSVKAPKVANNAIGAAQIATGAVGGDEVNEAGLGTVPAVQGFQVIPLQTPTPSATNADENAARAAAQRIELFNRGALTIYAKCFKDTLNPANPGMHAEIYVEAGPGAVFESAEDDSGSAYLEPAAVELNRQISDVISFAGPGNPGTLNIADETDLPFWVAQGGAFLEGSMIAGTKVGTPPAGDGVFGAGDRCLFGGTVRSG